MKTLLKEPFYLKTLIKIYQECITKLKQELVNMILLNVQMVLHPMTVYNKSQPDGKLKTCRFLVRTKMYKPPQMVFN